MVVYVTQHSNDLYIEYVVVLPHGTTYKQANRHI